VILVFEYPIYICLSIMQNKKTMPPIKRSAMNALAIPFIQKVKIVKLEIENYK
jgi:hypothetical protein